MPTLGVLLRACACVCVCVRDGGAGLSSLGAAVGGGGPEASGSPTYVDDLNDDDYIEVRNRNRNP